MPGYAMIKQQRFRRSRRAWGRWSHRRGGDADPTMVKFESLTDPAGTSVLEQD
ncbi:MAG: hypothetical protein R3B49_07040 [Phycisphaerales bacterium]